jgi:hypothetical protein
MRIAVIDDTRALTAPGMLPLRLEQRADVSRSVASALMALPFVGLSGTLVTVAVVSVVSGPDGIAVLGAKPVASLGLLAAVAVSSLLAAVPISAAISRIGRRQSVVVTGDEVTVEERSLAGVSEWRAPLSSFRGLSHCVRTSLSGARHEIVLVHPDTERSILLAVQPRVTVSDVERMARVLSLPVLIGAAGPVQVKQHEPKAADYQPIAA